jgi:hypothetical protein
MVSLSKHSKWIQHFFRESKNLSLLPEGDYTADTFVSTGVVVISAAVTRSRRPTHLAAFTGLPLEFIAMVLCVMDDTSLWSDESYVSLVNLLERTRDIRLIETQACCAVDALWESFQTPYYGLLDEFRRGFVLGGLQRDFPADD